MSSLVMRMSLYSVCATVIVSLATQISYRLSCLPIDVQQMKCRLKPLVSILNWAMIDKTPHLNLRKPANLAARAPRVTLRSLAILLLAWISTRAALWGALALRRVSAWLLSVPLLGWLSIRLLTLRCAILAWRRCAVLAALRRSTVLLLLAVTLLGWASVTNGRGVGFLILGVVGAVDSTEKELDNPQIGSKVDRGVGT